MTDNTLTLPTKAEQEIREARTGQITTGASHLDGPLDRDLIRDALETLWAHAPTRRADITHLSKQLGEWHNHDTYEQHCDPRCPAWFDGPDCIGCGYAHHEFVDELDVEPSRG